MFLVIGASGKTGSEVVRQLREAGQPVRGIIRDPAKRAPLEKHGAQIEVTDLSDKAVIQRACEGIRGIYLATSVTHDQVIHHRNVFEAAKTAGVGLLVRLGAMAVAGTEAARMVKMHQQSERDLQASGIAWTLLRPTWFDQNLLAMADRIRGQGEFVGAMRDGKIAPIDTRDVAAVAVQCLTKSGHAGRAYDLTGPQLLTAADMATTLGRVLEKTVRYVDVPRSVLKQGLVQMGTPDWLAEDLGQLYESYAMGAGARTSPSVQEITGRLPRTFEQFVRDHRGTFLSTTVR